MEFKEFLDKQEEELFDANVDRLDEIIGTGLKFLGGLGGNFVSQATRGLGNAAVGLGQSAVGTGQGVVGALQAASGGFKKGRETLGRATSNLGGGGGKILRGVTQLGGALTGVSPILRAAQAASEPIGVSGVYAPSSQNRSYAQDLLGLDSWEKPDVKPSERSTNPPEKSPEPEQIKSNGEIESWQDLVDQYKAAKTQPSSARKAIRAKMMKHYPHRYLQAIEALRQKNSKK